MPAESRRDHTPATERLRTITAKRDQFLGEARAALDGGQPKSAVKILQCASQMFSQDAEIAALLEQCRQQVRELTELLSERVPVLARERKLCELGRLIASLEISGVQVQGIARYKSALEKSCSWWSPRCALPSRALPEETSSRPSVTAVRC